MEVVVVATVAAPRLSLLPVLVPVVDHMDQEVAVAAVVAAEVAVMSGRRRNDSDQASKLEPFSPL